MWSVYTIIGYFVLALLVPIGWALGRTWLKKREPREVTCPEIGGSATIRLDPWYAIRMHARGDDEFRVRACSRWPGQGDCEQPCLVQVRPCS
jgi:hypothetical protein